MIDLGYNVEFWDISYLTRREYAESFKPIDPMAFDNLKVIDSIGDFKQLLSRRAESNSLFFFISSFPDFILKEIKQSGVDFVVHDFKPMPSISKRDVLMSYVRKRDIGKLVAKVIGLLKDRIVKKKTKVAPVVDVHAKYAMIVNEKSWRKSLANGETKPVHVPSPDYTTCAINNKTEQQEIAFIDQGFVRHPDLNRKDQDKITHHYKSLNKFFDIIEEKFGCEVVISAHPRVEYDENLFGGRKIYYKDAANQVRNAKLVLTFYSTALSYAVYYNKPLMFLHCKYIESLVPISFKYTYMLADRLKSPLVGINNTSKAKRLQLPKVDNQTYSRFKNLYLKKNTTPEQNAFEILDRAIRC